MSNNPPYFIPFESEQLFNSETGEFVYSPSGTIWVDTYDQANCVQKLQKSISAFGGRIRIKTPPPPSPEFLPNAYYRLPEEDLSKYSNFEDYIQKNHKKYNF